MRLTQVLQEREKAANDLAETKSGIGRRNRERKEAAKVCSREELAANWIWLEAWERWPLSTSITSSGWKVPWLTFMMLDRDLVAVLGYLSQAGCKPISTSGRKYLAERSPMRSGRAVCPSSSQGSSRPKPLLASVCCRLTKSFSPLIFGS